MSQQGSKLGIFTILLTLVGIVVLTQSQQWGLTIIFLSILIYAVTIVRNRLQAIGAEAFALGSIIVWLGFFLASFPLIAFAWDFLDRGVQTILFGIGVLMIFIGFTTEYYDLNVKFLAFLSRFRKRLRIVLHRLRTKLFRSVWTVVAIICLLLAILSLIFDGLAAMVPNITGMTYGVAIQFVSLAALSLIIEFRVLLGIMIESVVQTITLVMQALFIRLKHFPQLVADSARFLFQIGSRFFHRLVSLLLYLRTNAYILGLLGSLGIGSLAITRADQVLGSAAVLLLLIALINILAVRSDAIGIRVGNIQQSAYRQSFKVRNLIRRTHSGNCPQCEYELDPGTSTCENCGNFIPNCLVCRNTIYAGDEILTCPNCEHVGHASHVERWLSIRPICPNCRTEWK